MKAFGPAPTTRTRFARWLGRINGRAQYRRGYHIDAIGYFAMVDCQEHTARLVFPRHVFPRLT